MLLGLLATLAMLFGGLYLLKRLQGARISAPGALRVIGATAVGTREKVVLVAVGKQVLVLGVSPGRIAALHTLDAEDIPQAAPAAASSANGPSEFAMRLKQLLERRRES
jgi:flagellar protein FliO/FliZ